MIGGNVLLLGGPIQEIPLFSLDDPDSKGKKRNKNKLYWSSGQSEKSTSKRNERLFLSTFPVFGALGNASHDAHAIREFLRKTATAEPNDEKQMKVVFLSYFILFCLSFQFDLEKYLKLVFSWKITGPR